MKAKEYAARITNAHSLEQATMTLGQVGKEFFNEFVEMRKQRNISTDAGLLNLIKEFDNKFRTLSILIDGKYKGIVRPDGFVEMLKEFSPPAYNFYTSTFKK